MSQKKCDLEGAVGTSDKICKYHQVNSCPFGITCKFPHNLETGPTPSTSGTPVENSWVNAPEFVPMHRRLMERYYGYQDPNVVQENGLCQICSELEIHSLTAPQQRLHIIQCAKTHPEMNDFSRAVIKSLNKQCTICLDVVFEKEMQSYWPLTKLPDYVKFGILPNCCHIFCLSCIRIWRQSTEFENNAVRGCPACRVFSEFVCPSTTWAETPEEKTKMIRDYKNALSNKDCKYFKYVSILSFSLLCFLILKFVFFFLLKGKWTLSIWK